MILLTSFKASSSCSPSTSVSLVSAKDRIILGESKLKRKALDSLIINDRQTVNGILCVGSLPRRCRVPSHFEWHKLMLPLHSLSL